jgi:hypothetical protein
MWKALVIAIALLAAVVISRFGYIYPPAHSIAAMISELCGDEAPFLAENEAAMRRMMSDMNIEPSGDVDRDFSAMMIPHHQGAIEMAQAELRHGKNEQLRRIAQEIIVGQQQEIAAMRYALGQSLPASTAAPDQPADLSASVTSFKSRSASIKDTMTRQ